MTEKGVSLPIYMSQLEGESAIKFIDELALYSSSIGGGTVGDHAIPAVACCLS